MDADMPISAHHSDAIDETKGVLIFLIVLGHNTILMGEFDSLRVFLYNWHVFGFFLLTFLLPFRAEAPGFLGTRFFRYAVPYLLFYTAAWFMHLAVNGAWRDPVAAVGSYLLAGATGSADLLDEAASARLFWFLPALMGLVLIRWALDRMAPSVRWLAPAIALLGFTTAGYISDDIGKYIPLGLPIALYVLLPGMLFAKAVQSAFNGAARRQATALAIALIVLAVMVWAADMNRTRLVLAQFAFYNLSSPIALVNHALLAISATAAVVLVLTLLPRMGWLRQLGRLSLMIYLSHQFLYVPLRMVAGRAFPAWLDSHPVAVGTAVMVVTFGGAAAFALVVDRIEFLRRLLSPRDWSDWSGNFRRLTRRPA
jgi:fucose 4-O-acetylase-like acetyltransferase